MNEREIFTAALDRNSPEERKAFLDEACGDDVGLRRRVEALLKSHQEAGSFLERPVLADEPTFGLNQTIDSNRVPLSGDEGARPSPQAAEEVSLDFLQPCDTPDRLGKIGPYEVLEVVGRGGMGIVLLGRDPKLNRNVAIKVLAPELAANPTAHRRFLREARAAAAVSHVHVVTIHAVEESERLPGTVLRLPYLVMEYIPGCSLQERIDRTGPLELKEILRIGMQTAAGLAAAHAHGLVHRDIKPANILLENGVERVKITDFGLARAVDDVGMTQTGVVAGTPQYMAPEQARGHFVDHRADLFSLGCVLYAMSTGRSPFRAESTVAVIRRICDDTPRPIQEVNPDIPDWLVQIIDKLLAKDPDERFQSAAEVAELLGKYLAHVQHPSMALKPVGPATEATELFRRPKKRARGRAWALAAVLLLLLGGLAATEATGVTNVREFLGTVLRIRTPEGTLVVEVGDPEINVTVDGEEITLENVGPHEIRLRPGKHQLQATKDGVPVRSEWISISRGGRQVVKVDLVPLAQARPPAVQSGSPTESTAPVMQIARAKRVFAGPSAAWNDDVVISPDGKRALTGGSKGQVCLWDIETGRELRRFEGHTAEVRSVAISPDGRYGLSSARDATMRLWDLETGKQVRPFKGHTGWVESVAFSPDGRLIVSTSADFAKRLDNTVRLWDVQTGRELRRLKGCLGHINDIAFSPDGKNVAGGDDRQIFVWNVETGQLVHRLGFEGTRVADLAFSPDCRFLVSGHLARSKKDGKLYDPEHSVLKLWDLKSGRVLRTFRGHTGSIRDLAFSPDGRHILSASSGEFGFDSDGSTKFYQSDDRSIRLWDVETGRELVRYLPYERLLSIAFTPDGRSFLSAGDASLRLWDVPPSITATPQPLTEVRRFQGHTRMITSVAVSPDGRYLLSGVQGGGVLLSNLETGQTEKTFAGHPEGVFQVAFGRDGTAFSCSADQTARRWDVQSGEEIGRYVGHTGWVSALAVSPDGKHLLTGSMRHAQDQQGIPDDNSLRLWDVETGKEVRRFEDILFAIKGVAFASDGKSIVAGGENTMLGLWDVETGKRIGGFLAHTNVVSVAFSPDGAQVASSHAGGLKDGKLFDPEHSVIILWDVKTGREIRPLRGHTAKINSIAYSPDGRFIASAAGGGYTTGGWYDAQEHTVRIWNAASGEELARAETEITVQSVAFTPDGRHVVTGGGRRANPASADLRLWKLPESLGPKDVADVSRKPDNAVQLEVKNTEEKTAPVEPTEHGESPPPKESPATNGEDDQTPVESSPEEQPATSDS